MTWERLPTGEGGPGVFLFSFGVPGEAKDTSFQEDPSPNPGNPRKEGLRASGGVLGLKPCGYCGLVETGYPRNMGEFLNYGCVNNWDQGRHSS